MRRIFFKAWRKVGKHQYVRRTIYFVPKFSKQIFRFFLTFPILKILQFFQSSYNLPTVCVNTSDYSMLFKEFFLFVDSGSPPSWILPTPTACRGVGCFAYSRDIGGLETNPSLYERPVILHPSPLVLRISHSVQYSKVGHCLVESVEMYTRRVRPIKNTCRDFNENIYVWIRKTN